MPNESRLPLRCWAEIDLGALERNLKRIRSTLPKHLRYVAVVKADAYGHGLPQTAARLMYAGADLFAVANVAEAAALRELGPGWPILLLGACLPEEDRSVAEFDLIATVSSADEVERLDAVGRARRQKLAVHLKIDTGMGRLGVWHREAAALSEKILAAKNLRLEGVYTHFASADSDSAFTRAQRKLFLETLRRCVKGAGGNLLIHADNSAGLETLQKRSPFNAVRVGLLQFGIPAHTGGVLSKAQTEPVFSFHGRVSLVKDLPRGTGISYLRTHVLKRDSRIAVLTAGYGDGVPLASSNRGAVLVRGHRCPILGRVTMDQTIVDVTDVKEPVVVGDQATFVGSQGDDAITAAEFARWAESIPYEILCSVTKRVPRIYRTTLGT